MKYFKKLVKYSFVFALIILSSIYFILSTNLGTQVLFKMISLAIPGSLSVKHIAGKLTGNNIIITNLTYRDPQQNILNIDRLQFSGVPLLQLWSKKMIAQNILINDMSYHLNATHTSQKHIPKKTFAENISAYKKASNLLQYFEIKQFKIVEFKLFKQQQLLEHVASFSLQQQQADYLIDIKSSMGDLQGRINLAFHHDLTWEIVLDGQHIHPQLFHSGVNGDFKFSLASRGHYDFSDAAHSLQMQLKLNPLEGEINHQPLKGVIAFTIDNHQMHIEDSHFIIGNAMANIAGTINDTYNISWTLSIPDIHPYLKNANGTFTSEGKILGTHKSPEMHGHLQGKNIIVNDYHFPELSIHTDAQMIDNGVRINVNEGHILLPQLNLKLQNFNLKSSYHFNQSLTFNGEFTTENNRTNVAKFNGTLDIHQPNMPLNLNIDGENILLANLQEYQIKVSPNLTIHYDQHDTNINGKIFIPYAKIKPRDFSSTVSLPDDVVYLTDEKQQNQGKNPTSESASSTTNHLALNLQIFLGDKVYLDYHNLHAHLGGNLNLNQGSGGAMTAIGELHTLDGKYQAYNKSLTIEQGRILYTGNLISNPGLDIRAATKIKTIEFKPTKTGAQDKESLKTAYQGEKTISVGVIARGTINKPKVTLFSDPSGISQNDILSYLIFGYPQSKIKNSSSLVLLNHLVTNLNSGNNNHSFSDIPETIKNILGLSELNIGNMDYYDKKNSSFENATTVNIGKNIGKKLSIHYTTGVFQPVSILSLKYEITKRLILKSETSSIENGADLVYEFERD